MACSNTGWEATKSARDKAREHSPFNRAGIAGQGQAVTVHFYAQLGVPVSTSQAIVGAVLGIGLFKGVKTINRRIVANIFFGWLCTPLIAGFVCWTAAKIFL